MAWRVAWAMAHLQGVLAERDYVAVVQPACGRERTRGGEVVAGSGLWQTVNPKLIAFVRADDGQVQLLGQIGGGTGVVDVGVGDPNLLQLHTELLACVCQHGQIATGIDDGGLHRFIAPDDGTVLLERGNGNGFVLQHSEMVARIVAAPVSRATSDAVQFG